MSEKPTSTMPQETGPFKDERPIQPDATQTKLKALEKQFQGKQNALKVFTEPLQRSSKELGRGELGIATIKQYSESPTSPATDEVRIYYKTLDGRLIKFTGTEV